MKELRKLVVNMNELMLFVVEDAGAREEKEVKCVSLLPFLSTSSHANVDTQTERRKL
jgi:hypothetical protein